MIFVTKATLADWSLLISLDTHLSKEKIKEKIERQEIFLAKENNKIIGFLRFNYFWDELPFINLLFVEADHRKQGIGSALMNAFEQQMKELGYSQILLSTQSDEEGQHFYRKLNYTDCGALLLSKEPTELFFVKKLDSYM
ncbi:hypothetical protein RV11_GL001193 [Enterococcus phoeniculicola]|jgi:GNAT superfamily N-acetyltransferase|uniref:N-acetyltransferase domain-containing protein n=1 Tax=Enterococcus phoeniculicola ATCC BAA-412 TaxID=1158610 RepID=R3WE00_9ENTE|nr:GNAT family N-acetyltransferase [Enterococcus phoeniculicola]EOL46081.1 hypothetical protein UC3_00886 [Enterococcus phoeniculicola ATCC BAA-412]EOT77074.1 hypothetical protein I589_02036 [Enterococcus phoeniculicola ATCC BAA-412]OJG73413.1 hypothetical protein RV11_GL001193 [Enterococcus phoeniculicola]